MALRAILSPCIDGDETLVEETVETDSERGPWLREVGVVEHRPVRTSRNVTSGRSSKPRRRQVLYFPHRRLWITEYSCKVWCKPCRRRLIPRQHFRHSWRPRVAVVLGGKGVDANLRILQDAWRTVERVAVTNRARKRCGVVQFPWEFAKGSV
ncbi:hypothetical protein Taro_029636 [Colocasia esculenta]|uniref:Uncharacterized protein n=1 Tax=Colocasia esculenta TaxID=4460 RepID=A0A843W0U4_COLES|nr:hypothetical protein [Colocasia esculenta]